MRNIDDLLNHLQKPELPPDLRTRVLQAATQSTPEIQPRLTDRLWENRGLRLIWAGALVILLILNLAATQHRQGPRPAVQAEKTTPPQDPIVQELMEMLPPQHVPDLDSASAEELSRIMAELDRPMAGPKPKGNRT